MSKKCNHCKKESFNNHICDNCKMPINETNNWKENYKTEIEEKKIKIDKGMIITISIFIIALSIAFNAYSKYREQKQIEEVMKTYTNMIGVAGLQAIDANEQIRKSLEQLKNFQHK